MAASFPRPSPGHFTQGLKGDLGVEPGRILRAVPEHLGDLRKGRTMADHSGRQTVAEHVGRSPAGADDPNAGQQLSDNVAHGSWASQPLYGGLQAKERTPGCASTAVQPEVEGHGFANVGWQGKVIPLLPFAPYEDFT